ncbi:MAG: PLP-dependent transferase [Acidimicrobiia bacterium]|nr:PLP-dependent transferase [Acidimicrobiia bacterium]
MSASETPESVQPEALQPETVTVRAGRPEGQASMAPVLWASTTYDMGTLEEGRQMAHSTRAKKFYSRHGNPTVNAFESAVAELEGAEAARAYASGMGG